METATAKLAPAQPLALESNYEGWKPRC